MFSDIAKYMISMYLMCGGQLGKVNIQISNIKIQSYIQQTIAYKTFKSEVGAQMGPNYLSAINMQRQAVSGFANKRSDQGKNSSHRIICNLEAQRSTLDSREDGKASSWNDTLRNT